MAKQNLINNLITVEEHEVYMRQRFETAIVMLRCVVKTYGGLHQIVLSEEFEALEQTLSRMTENHDYVDHLNDK